MKKLSNVVSEIISGKPFLEEAMLYGYLNFTAFSEYIRPYIEKEIGRNISVHAIKMALSRFEWVDTVLLSTESKWLTKISTRTNLAIITLARTSKNIELVTQFMTEKRRDTKYFFTMIEGVHEIDIIFDHDLTLSMDERFSVHSRILTVSWLGLVTGELSDSEISTPGLFYRVSKRLAFHDVNIIQVLSTYHELGIIVREEDLKKALFVLMD